MDPETQRYQHLFDLAGEQMARSGQAVLSEQVRGLLGVTEEEWYEMRRKGLANCLDEKGEMVGWMWPAHVRRAWYATNLHRGAIPGEGKGDWEQVAATIDGRMEQAETWDMFRYQSGRMIINWLANMAGVE